MSNMPDGCGSYAKDREIPKHCSNGHTWTALAFYELGQWWLYRDDDDQCEVCGEWAEKEED